MKPVLQLQLLLLAGFSLSSATLTSIDQIQELQDYHEKVKTKLKESQTKELAEIEEQRDSELNNAQDFHNEQPDPNAIIPNTKITYNDYFDSRKKFINDFFDNQKKEKEEEHKIQQQEMIDRQKAEMTKRKKADTALQEQLEKVTTTENMNDKDTRKTIEKDRDQNIQKVKNDNEKIITAINELTLQQIKELQTGPDISKDDSNYQIQRALQGTGKQGSPFEHPLDTADKSLDKIKQELAYRVNEGLDILVTRINSRAEQQIKDLTAEPSSDEDEFDTINESDTQDTSDTDQTSDTGTEDTPSDDSSEKISSKQSWLPKTIRRWLHNLGLRNDAEIAIENKQEKPKGDINDQIKKQIQRNTDMIYKSEQESSIKPNQPKQTEQQSPKEKIYEELKKKPLDQITPEDIQNLFDIKLPSIGYLDNETMTNKQKQQLQKEIDAIKPNEIIGFFDLQSDIKSTPKFRKKMADAINNYKSNLQTKLNELP